jgi:hypothetical protein
MKNAKQHIIDILDDPTGHQNHAKRFVPLFTALFPRLILFQLLGIRGDDPSIWKNPAII